MKILLTGVTGYIAQRMVPVLLENGHDVVCCVRDKNRFNKKIFFAKTHGNRSGFFKQGKFTKHT